MKNLITKTTIKASFTADQWELFDQAGRGVAARALNTALNKAINTSNEPGEVYGKMREAQSKYAEFGADDGEAERLIERVVNKVWPEANY